MIDSKSSVKHFRFFRLTKDAFPFPALLSVLEWTETRKELRPSDCDNFVLKTEKFDNINSLNDNNKLLNDNIS